MRQGVAQSGRALGLGLRGRRFESCHPDHLWHKELKSKVNNLLLLWRSTESAGRVTEETGVHI